MNQKAMPTAQIKAGIRIGEIFASPRSPRRMDGAIKAMPQKNNISINFSRAKCFFSHGQSHFQSDKVSRAFGPGSRAHPLTQLLSSAIRSPGTLHLSSLKRPILPDTQYIRTNRFPSLPRVPKLNISGVLLPRKKTQVEIYDARDHPMSLGQR